MSDDHAARVAALRPLLDQAFPHSRPDSRAALASTAGFQTFGRGHTMFRQGDATPVALVLDGHVAMLRASPDGRQLIVRIIDRGKLGAVFPLIARPSAADFVALTRVPVALWRGEWLRSLAAADPGLGLDLLEHILVTYEEVVGRLDGLVHQDALRRVARILHLHAELFFSDEPVLTRGNLPMLVGTSREMTGRVLRVLEARSIVARVGRDRLRLLDRAALAAAASDPGR